MSSLPCVGDCARLGTVQSLMMWVSTVYLGHYPTHKLISPSEAYNEAVSSISILNIFTWHLKKCKIIKLLIIIFHTLSEARYGKNNSLIYCVYFPELSLLYSWETWQRKKFSNSSNRAWYLSKLILQTACLNVNTNLSGFLKGSVLWWTALRPAQTCQKPMTWKWLSFDFYMAERSESVTHLVSSETHTQSFSSSFTYCVWGTSKTDIQVTKGRRWSFPLMSPLWPPYTKFGCFISCLGGLYWTFGDGYNLTTWTDTSCIHLPRRAIFK